MLSGISQSWLLLSARQKWSLFLLTLGRVLLNVVDVAGIAAVGVIAAVSLGSTDPDKWVERIPVSANHLLPALLGITAFIFLGKTILSSVLAHLTFRFLARIEATFSIEIAKEIFGGNLSDIKKLSKAEIDFAISHSASVAFTQVLGQASVLIVEFSLGLFVFILFASTDIVTASVVSGYFIAILIIFQLLTSGRLLKAGQTLAENSVSSTQVTLDMISTFRELFVLQKREYFLDRLRNSRQAAANSNATSHVISAIPRQVVELGLIIGALLFVALQSSSAPSGAGSFALGVYLMGSLRMMSALLPLQRAVATLRFIGPQAKVAQSLLYRESRSTLPSDVSAIRPERFLAENNRPFGVVAQGLSFAHDSKGGGETLAIRGIDLEILPGQFVAFIGPSGSGKTTLVDLLIGVHEPSEGQVSIQGISPNRILTASPGKIAYVPQRAGLIEGTLEANVALGIAPSERDPIRLLDALEKAGLANVVESLPSGVKTDMGKHADSLSGGQLQRIGLARALYQQPSLLVLDEATSSLDAESEEIIAQSLRALKGKTTIITVAHRLSTVQEADVLFLLNKGEIEARGSFKELLVSSKVVRNYVNLMSIKGSSESV